MPIKAFYSERNTFSQKAILQFIMLTHRRVISPNSFRAQRDDGSVASEADYAVMVCRHLATGSLSKNRTGQETTISFSLFSPPRSRCAVIINVTLLPSLLPSLLQKTAKWVVCLHNKHISGATCRTDMAFSLLSGVGQD